MGTFGSEHGGESYEGKNATSLQAYPPEFRQQMIEMVCFGRKPNE